MSINLLKSIVAQYNIKTAYQPYYDLLLGKKILCKYIIVSILMYSKHQYI